MSLLPQRRLDLDFRIAGNERLVEQLYKVASAVTELDTLRIPVLRVFVGEALPVIRVAGEPAQLTGRTSEIYAHAQQRPGLAFGQLFHRTTWRHCTLEWRP